MGKKKGGHNAKKKQERQQLLEEERLREESRKTVLQNALYTTRLSPEGTEELVPRNSLEGFPQSISLVKLRGREDSPLELRFGAEAELPEKVLEQCFELLKSNMEKMYIEADWVWSDKRKMNELREEGARILYVVDPEKDDKVAGFVHYRFLHDGEDEVLYVYEMQVDPEYSRKGMGKRLMVLLELIGRKFKMTWMMLTVFLCNEPAIQFYESLNYSEDETSPQVSDVSGENNEPDASYLILSKPLSALRKMSPKVEAVGLAASGISNTAAASPAAALAKSNETVVHAGTATQTKVGNSIPAAAPAESIVNSNGDQKRAMESMHTNEQDIADKMNKMSVNPQNSDSI